MRIVTRIRYRGDVSEPVLLEGLLVEICIQSGNLMIIRLVKTKKILVSKRCKTRRAARVAARRWLVGAGASLGFEVKKIL